MDVDARGGPLSPFDTEHDKWKGAILKDGLEWIQLIDEKGSSGTLGQYYSVDTIPLTILLDTNGKILGFRLSAKEVEEKMEKALLNKI